MENADRKYRNTFDAAIGNVIHQALRILADEPALAIPATRILYHQRSAEAVRRKHEEEGLLVPPVMIASITSRCNLACAGCYMHGRHERPAEMSPAVLASVADQADALGVSVMVIAGGEPLVRQEEILGIARAHPRVLFPVFSNGLLIDEPAADAFAGCRNIVPVISFEGFRAETDSRRGTGVYDRLLAACSLLRDRHIFFGCSVTTTRENFDRVTGDDFVRQMIGAGARVFTFVEYVPMAPGTEQLILTQRQKEELPGLLEGCSRQYPALFIGFPGDESLYGGCLAAGRGFVHVSPSGDLEPCPAAPFSDANLNKVPLREALRSRLLRRLRETPELLAETEGGCALRANRAWVGDLMVRE